MKELVLAFMCSFVPCPRQTTWDFPCVEHICKHTHTKLSLIKCVPVIIILYVTDIYIYSKYTIWQLPMQIMIGNIYFRPVVHDTMSLPSLSLSELCSSSFTSRLFMFPHSCCTHALVQLRPFTIHVHDGN